MAVATPLEEFVVKVRSLTFPGSLDSLHSFLTKNLNVLEQNTNLLDDVLETLNIREHSMGILAVLVVKFSSVPVLDFDQQYIQVRNFVKECDDQINFAPDLFNKLLHLLTLNVIERHQYIRGIPVLIEAIKKIQAFPSQLTAIHSDLCQLCLLAKCMKPALQFLDVDVTDINKAKGSYDTKSFLLYYYYGGMIYTSLKNYERALYFFEVAITTPSLAVSHVMLEAYKKYILVSLILHGKIPSPPKFTSQVVGRFIKPLSQVYHDLSHAYLSNSPADVEAVINRNAEMFTRDNNMGLAKQCLSFLFKKNIQRLTKTFITLSLSDMANRVRLADPAEAEFYVLKMIEDGQIFASINQKDGMVVFQDNPEKYNTPLMFQRLEEEMKKCITLDEKLHQMDEEITTNSKFIQKRLELRDSSPDAQEIIVIN